MAARGEHDRDLKASDGQVSFCSGARDETVQRPTKSLWKRHSAALEAGAAAHARHEFSGRGDNVGLRG